MKLLNMAFISVLAVLAHARSCDEKFDDCMEFWIEQDFPDINDLPQAYYDDFEACERKYYKADGHTCKSDDGGDDGDGDKCTKEQKENGECGNQKKKKRHHRRHVQHMRRAV